MEYKKGDLINGFKLISKSKKGGYWLVEHSCGNIYNFRICLAIKQSYCIKCSSDKKSKINKEYCLSKSLLFKNRSEFIKSNGYLYRVSIKNNWIDYIFSHMDTIGNLQKRAIYAFEFSDNSVYIGLTYNLNKRRSQHLSSKRSSVFKYYIETGIIPEFKPLTEYLEVSKSISLEGAFIDDYKSKGWKILNKKIHGDIGRNLTKWDYESCKLEALKYKDRTSFMRMSSGAYKSASINNWLLDITSHMDTKIKVNYWTKEKCLEESIKYTNRNQFKNNSCDDYSFAYRNGLLDEICSHMRRYPNNFKKQKIYE
jgi:predicted GIY-YIG superfamily endonuclease